MTKQLLATSSDIEHLFAEIEGHEFAISLGLASSERLFKELLASNDSVLALLQSIKKKPALTSAIIERVHSIELIETDPAYASPYDAALSAYLWVLNQCAIDQPGAAREAATRVLKIRDLWWSRIFALEIIEGHPTTASTTPPVVPMSFGEGSKSHRAVFLDSANARTRVVTTFADFLDRAAHHVAEGRLIFSGPLRVKTARWGRKTSRKVQLRSNRKHRTQRLAEWSN